MTKTNKKKLVSWDADFYNTLSDEYCIICVTEKQRYLLGETIRQVEWLTRWVGDTSGLDLNAIAGELQYGIANMEYCINITEILTIVTQLNNKVDKLQVDVDNIINNTNYDYPNGASLDTSISDVADTGYLNQPLGNYTSACSSDADRDALYGGCVALAEYMVQKITDLLELIDATSGQVSEIWERIVAAIPVVETLPVDEIAGTVNFFADHSLEAWNGVVTDERKKNLACLFYCYASSNGTCSLSLHDVVDLLGGKVSIFGDLMYVDMHVAIVAMITTTVVDDTLFYGLLSLMLVFVAQGQTFLDVNSFRLFELSFLAGTNSPDNDWSLFCTDCPTYYRVYEHDFSNGAGDFTIITGDVFSTGVYGLDDGDSKLAYISLTTPQAITLTAFQMEINRVGGIQNGSDDTQFMQLYSQPVGGTLQHSFHESFGTNGIQTRCNNPVGTPVGSLMYIGARVTDSPSSDIIIRRVKIWMPSNSQFGTLVTDSLPC